MSVYDCSSNNNSSLLLGGLLGALHKNSFTNPYISSQRELLFHFYKETHLGREKKSHLLLE